VENKYSEHIAPIFTILLKKIKELFDTIEPVDLNGYDRSHGEHESSARKLLESQGRRG